MFLFLKKSQTSAFFYSPFLPKKIGHFTAALSVTFVTPSLSATCNASNPIACNSYVAGAPATCCAPSMAQCVSLCSSSTIQPICPTSCPSTSSFTDVSGEPEFQAKCVILSDGKTRACQMQCSIGYYALGTEEIETSSGTVQSATKCIKCPDYGLCTGGVAKPSCDKGYYLWSLMVIGGTQYSCNRCPSYSYTNGPSGFNQTGYGVTAGRGADSVSDCYIPYNQITAGYYFHDGTGSAVITRNCYYGS